MKLTLEQLLNIADGKFNKLNGQIYGIDEKVVYGGDIYEKAVADGDILDAEEVKESAKKTIAKQYGVIKSAGYTEEDGIKIETYFGEAEDEVITIGEPVEVYEGEELIGAKQLVKVKRTNEIFEVFAPVAEETEGGDPTPNLGDNETPTPTQNPGDESTEEPGA